LLYFAAMVREKNKKRLAPAKSRMIKFILDMELL
jgi:hypothetical protein